jgi:hypothetical protein
VIDTPPKTPRVTEVKNNFQNSSKKFATPLKNAPKMGLNYKICSCSWFSVYFVGF